MKIRGTITSGTVTRTRPVSFGLVMKSIVKPPIIMSRLRKAIETLEPTAVWISVVSVVRRERTSPVRVTSKKAGLRLRMWL